MAMRVTGWRMMVFVTEEKGEVMKGKLLTDCKFCGNCHFTDGMIYTSNPPKVKCDFTGEYHDRNDLCSVELKPVVHARWILKDENGSGVCSNCHRQDKIDPLAGYCRYCGAKMKGANDE